MPNHGITEHEVRSAHKMAHGIRPDDANWFNPRWDMEPRAKDSWGIYLKPFMDLLDEAYARGVRDVARGRRGSR